jgi:toxin-antitoxin system PIN domain toxin
VSLLVDTNVLVYSFDERSALGKPCRAFIENRRSAGGIAVTWSILYELLRIMTHPKVLRRPLDPSAARGLVASLASDPSVEILTETARHAAVLDELLADSPPIRGNRYHDAHIAAVMRENGVGTIATLDRHFRVFAHLKVVDPTAAG